MTEIAAGELIALDRPVEDLVRGSARWTATPLDTRIALLERMMPRILTEAEPMVAAAARAKGYAADSPWAAEDWANGPWAIAQNVSAFLHVLRRVQEGADPIPSRAVRRRGDRTVVDVFPATTWDRLLLNGFRAEVWTTAGTTPVQARSRAAGEYRASPGRPAVSLVLGAGNVPSITALDILHKLFTEGHVVVAKMNPVNAYVRPHLEAVFAELIDQDWVRFVDGGPVEGSYLAHHPDVDEVHVTGSATTHDALVWGADEHAQQRRADDAPLLTKPFTSELGGVSPCIVVPGRWSAADFRYQAEHIVTSKLNNAGHNCIATQVLVLPTSWDGSDRLLDEIRAVLGALPPRPAYYPGAPERLHAVQEAHPHAQSFGADSCGLLVTAVEGDDPLVSEEVFAGVLAVVRLPGADAPAFLSAATDFANDVLPGTLGATLIVDPATEKSHRAAVDEAVTKLRYGTLGINAWSGVGFLLGYTPWGAHPGGTRHDIGSGVGFVHNAFMLDGVEKTVLRAPFAPSPRGLLTGSPSLSPKPPYFVTNRTGTQTVQRVTRFTARPSIRRLPGIFASALRG